MIFTICLISLAGAGYLSWLRNQSLEGSGRACRPGLRVGW